VAKAVALWVAAEARAELLLREMSATWLEELTAKPTSIGDRAGRQLTAPALV
jgi:hypothetical protein